MDDKMHQNMEFVTPPTCDLHHQLVEAKLEMLRQKDMWLEEKINGLSGRLDTMEEKIDVILKTQEDQFKLQIGLLIGIVLTLVGVLLGRGFDFGVFA